ncbi:MAG: PepSY domain-containing protein [Roseateles sp.]
MKALLCTRRGLLALLAVAALGAQSPLRADDRRDHERARAALRAGEILPLQQILQSVQRSHPGEVLEVELEREDGRWVYEIKLLQPGGRLMRLDVDARSAEVLRARPRAAASPAPTASGGRKP